MTMSTADEINEPTNSQKPVVKTDEEWKKQLSSQQYHILRKNGTERPFGQVYDDFKKQENGSYHCLGCDTKLFTTTEKINSNSGWPAFYDPADSKNITTHDDISVGMIRTEVRCATCDGHLGHVFKGEGFNTPTDLRYCINGIILKFVPNSDQKASE